MILIGSSAIKHWYPDFKREPKDIDYAIGINGNKSKPSPVRGVEYLINPILDRLYKPHNGIIEICSLGHLTTLKASHLCWDINWEKHMFDLQFLLNKGNEIEEELFWELYDYWNTYHSKNKRSDLKMSKDEFFSNAINYDVAEHDDLHLLINPTPTYTKILKDGCEVELDEEKYNLLTHEEKLDLIREEVYVMAYERWKNIDYRTAYLKMLKKFILSHAPKFTLLFILKNYIELQNTKNIINYKKQINDGINQYQSSK
jgi:hypothetical protein